jgi:hypothetical protein
MPDIGVRGVLAMGEDIEVHATGRSRKATLRYVIS